MKKPVILTNFGYHRKNWIFPLEAIKDEFEVIYVHFNRKSDEVNNFTTSRVAYFSDFKNARELIDTFRPDIFIAMGLQSNLMYAVRYVCKQRKIPFVYMDHGFYGTANDYKEVATVVGQKKLTAAVVNSEEGRSRNFTFAIDTFTQSFAVFRLAAMIWINLLVKITKKSTDQFKTLLRYLVRPDAFLTYTRLNNARNQELFEPAEKDVFLIGNFEYDKFTGKAEALSAPYLLLIDSPISDNPFGKFYITIEEHIKIYEKVNRLAGQHGLPLKIKLHPSNYTSAWLPELDNVTYIRECADLNSLIRNAKYCVGFVGTLLIPAINFIPTAVLKVNENSLLDFIEKNDLCNIYSVYDLAGQEITFKENSGMHNAAFRDAYFPVSEKTSIERLKQAIYDIIKRKQDRR